MQKDICKRLEENAWRDHRSLSAEIVAIFRDEDGWVRRRLEIAAALPELDRAREEVAREYGELSDSVNLTRDIRDDWTPERAR